MSLRVLKLDSLYATLIVKIASILIVRYTLWEGCLHNEVSRLLVEVLLQVGANDDVHGCGLSDLILMQTAVLVRFKDQWADLSQDAKFLVGNRDEVNSFGSESVESTQGYTTDTNKDEVSEFLSVLQVTIIDQLHDEKHVEEHLALSNL